MLPSLPRAFNSWKHCQHLLLASQCATDTLFTKEFTAALEHMKCPIPRDGIVWCKKLGLGQKVKRIWCAQCLLTQCFWPRCHLLATFSFYCLLLGCPSCAGAEGWGYGVVNFLKPRWKPLLNRRLWAKNHRRVRLVPLVPLKSRPVSGAVQVGSQQNLLQGASWSLPQSASLAAALTCCEE